MTMRKRLRPDRRRSKFRLEAEQGVVDPDDKSRRLFVEGLFGLRLARKHHFYWLAGGRYWKKGTSAFLFPCQTTVV